jgi:hypothetical protein
MEQVITQLIFANQIFVRVQQGSQLEENVFGFRFFRRRTFNLARKTYFVRFSLINASNIPVMV